MKLFFTFLLLGLILPFSSYSQIENHPTLFAQCMIQIDSKPEMDSLQALIRQNPHTNIVRLDWNTKRVFLLTQDIDTLSIAEFKSWFGDYSNKLTCIQIGVHGVDVVNPYPFTNCEN